MNRESAYTPRLVLKKFQTFNTEELGVNTRLPSMGRDTVSSSVH